MSWKMPLRVKNQYFLKFRPQNQLAFDLTPTTLVSGMAAPVSILCFFDISQDLGYVLFSLSFPAASVVCSLLDCATLHRASGPLTDLLSF